MKLQQVRVRYINLILLRVIFSVIWAYLFVGPFTIWWYDILEVWHISNNSMRELFFKEGILLLFYGQAEFVKHEGTAFFFFGDGNICWNLGLTRYPSFLGKYPSFPDGEIIYPEKLIVYMTPPENHNIASFFSKRLDVKT